MVLFFAHIRFMVNRAFQCNASGVVATTSLLLTTNHTDCTFVLWRFHMAQPSHPGHSTILLRSESPANAQSFTRWQQR